MLADGRRKNGAAHARARTAPPRAASDRSRAQPAMNPGSTRSGGFGQLTMTMLVFEAPKAWTSW